mgnify:CR=1 FL=1
MHHWLSMTEFTDLITISQMTPGPIAINAATFVGMKLTGMPGAVVATLGYITPSCIIVTINCKFVFKIPGNGHAAGNTWRDQTGGGRTDRIGGNFHFADSILGSFREMVISDTSWLMVGIFVVCVILLRKVKMNPIWVMVLAGVMKVGVELVWKM